MSATTPQRRIGFEEFMAENAATVARSELEGFATEIMAALKKGHTYTSIAAWLKANGIDRVTRQSLQGWVTRRQHRAARRAAQLNTEGSEAKSDNPAAEGSPSTRLLAAASDDAVLAEMHRSGLVGAGLRAALSRQSARSRRGGDSARSST